jgi:hypothetical protein
VWRNISCGEDKVGSDGSVGSKQLSILALSDEYIPLLGGAIDVGGHETEGIECAGLLL